nr:hypothetical protein [Tanacetum cinerariifolium]
MAHQQLVVDVYLGELYPPNKRYDLMDANKKIDMEHVQCPPENKIVTNIIKNHPLRFSIAAYSFVPWIYMAQSWHTLKEDGLKYRLKFMLDKKELSLTLDEFRTIFHLPQAIDNNHDSFVPPLSFYDMIPLLGIISIYDYWKKGIFSQESIFQMFRKRFHHKIGFKVFSEVYSEYGIKLMLALRSAKARYSMEHATVQGIRKLPGSPSLGGSLFEQLRIILCLKRH